MRLTTSESGLANTPALGLCILQSYVPLRVWMSESAPQTDDAAASVRLSLINSIN